MKSFANLLTALIITTWITFIAIFSVQNYKMISLQFLVFQSVPIPIGVVLTFCAGAGIILGAIAPILLIRSNYRRQSLRAHEN